jgi:hypothetical protein
MQLREPDKEGVPTETTLAFCRGAETTRLTRVNALAMNLLGPEDPGFGRPAFLPPFFFGLPLARLFFF